MVCYLAVVRLFCTYILHWHLLYLFNPNYWGLVLAELARLGCYSFDVCLCNQLISIWALSTLKPRLPSFQKVLPVFDKEFCCRMFLSDDYDCYWRRTPGRRHKMPRGCSEDRLWLGYWFTTKSLDEAQNNCTVQVKGPTIHGHSRSVWISPCWKQLHLKWRKHPVAWF